ncbi:MAG: radical SAM protein [Lachnospiraceae bacterium]|nr:radical SAM protein [Lachnospiraceae bacterium]
MDRQLSLLEQTEYETCRLCPRACGVNRIKGRRGFCGMGAQPMVARAALHFWEEPCISGENGSGTVFFAGCNLRCVFCQNQEISRGQAGKEISTDRLSEIFLELQDKGAHNINLVTGVLFIPSIVTSLKQAKEEGLKIPIVYNCGGYESVEALRLLEGLIDIYLPDFKYWNGDMAERYSHAEDYPDRAKEALKEMVRQVGGPIFSPDGILQKGIVVRHLLLPGQRKEAEAILDYLYTTYGDKIYISIMNQYTPMAQSADKNLERKVTTYEYDKTIDFALNLGVKNGFMQKGNTASESFIPPFDLEGV